MGDENSRKRAASSDAEGEGEHETSAHAGRQRSRAACTPCRQRKRKCDGRLPCKTCLRYEYTCEYATPSRKSTFNHEGDVAQDATQTKSSGPAAPSIVQLQAHPLTAPGARFHHRSIFDPVKTRFVRANSALAFPRILSMDLEADSVPRLHSFAWHLGIRPEPVEPDINLLQHLTWPEMQKLAAVYFKVIKPELGLPEEADFMEQVALRFKDPSGYHDVDAVALGIAALGSFFSSEPHPREDQFVYSAKRQLVLKSVHHSPNPSHVAGWTLRTFYLRLTGRPHGAWMASCISMHLVEASGLHKEMQTIAVVYPAVPTGDHKLAKTRRRLFWIARALNIILSFEVGRTQVYFDVVTTKKFASENGGHAHQLVELAEMLPNDFVDRDREPDPPAALGNALSKIEAMPTESHFISMLKADLAFAIYRRLWLMSLTDAKDRSDTVMAIGRSAFLAARHLLDKRLPWWNVVCTPFHFLCVIIAIGTPKALATIQEVMALMHDIVQVYDTHLVREAYSQASALVSMARKRKQKELDALMTVPEHVPLVDHPSASASTTMTPGVPVDWLNATDLPFEWDMFLNPELVVSNQQGQSIIGPNGLPQMVSMPNPMPNLPR